MRYIHPVVCETIGIDIHEACAPSTPFSGIQWIESRVYLRRPAAGGGTRVSSVVP